MMKAKKAEERRGKLEDFFEFAEWVQQILDPFKRGCVRDGCIIDDFGGELFIAYRSPSSSSEHVERLFDRLFGKEERETVEPFLVKAQQAYPGRVHDKLRQALHDLTLEMLYPA